MDWDQSKISGLSEQQLENLRQNALRRNVGSLVELCNAELAIRGAAKRGTPRAPKSEDIVSKSVIGFHFVCDNEKGVTRNSDGSCWSGTWVVDKKVAEESLQIGAYVALHKSKSEPSYIQGKMKAFRVSQREGRYGEQDVKIPSGIDFLIEPTPQPYGWVGDGTGEKGYAR